MTTSHRGLAPPVGRLAQTLALVLALSSAASAQTSVVNDIMLIGLQTVPEETVRAVMNVAVGDEYSESATLNDLRSIMELGLFDGASTVDLMDLGDGVRLIYKLVENPRIASVSLEGVTLVPEAELLQAMEGIIEVGSIFNTRTVDIVYQRLSAVYQDRGYHVAMAPPAFGEEGDLTLSLIEATVANTTCTVTGGNYINPDALLDWLGPPLDSYLQWDVVQECRQKGLDSGLFMGVVVEIAYGETLGRAQINYTGELAPRPYPSVDAAPFIVPELLIASLDHYRDDYFDTHHNPMPPSPPSVMEERRMGLEADDMGAAFDLFLDLLRLQQFPEAKVLATRIETGMHPLYTTNDLSHEDVVKLARVKLFLGKRYDATQMLTSVLDAGESPIETYASVVQAATMRMGELAAQGAAIPEGADLAWAVGLMSPLDSADPLLAQEPAPLLSRAVRAGLDHYDALSPEALYDELPAYARFINICDYLNDMPAPLRPADLDARLSQRVGLPLSPTYYDKRLLGALEAKLATAPDDADARYAYANCVIHREVSIVLGDARLPQILGLDDALRQQSHTRARSYLEALVAARESEFPFARGLLATSLAIQGELQLAQEALLPAFDGPMNTGATNLYVSSVYLDMIANGRDDQYVSEQLSQALAMIRVHLSTVKGVAAEAREAEYRIEAALGLIDDALASAKRHAEIAPSDGDPLAALAFFELRKRQTDTALRTVQRAATLEPDNPWVNYTLGLALLAAGQPTSASKYMDSMRFEMIEHRLARLLGV